MEFIAERIDGAFSTRNWSFVANPKAESRRLNDAPVILLAGMDWDVCDVRNKVLRFFLLHLRDGIILTIEVDIRSRDLSIYITPVI
jgi:hypothetical protein